MEKLNDKKSYLEQITKEKKKLTKKIESIDKLTNNKELLEKEYEKRNAKLPNKEKIFSIRQLVNILEIERQQYINQIKELNILIDPKGYVDRKEKMTSKLEFLNQLDLKTYSSSENNLKQNENNEIIHKNAVIELCRLFLVCFQIKIKKSHTKAEILSYIYELRYYRFIPFLKEGTFLKDEEELQEDLEETSKLLLEKAKILNVLEEVTENEKVNYEIEKQLLDTKIIELEHIVVETKVENGKLYALYYDTNILDSTVEIPSEQTVRLKKKTKLLI